MNEKIDAVLKANGDALENVEQVSSADCIALLNATAPCRVAIEERRAAIWPARTSGNVGPIRAKALRTGTAAEIVALDEESETLDILWQKVKVQTDALSNCREHARDEEASASLPTLHADFAEKLSAAEAARDALNTTLSALDAGLDTIVAARVRATKSALPAAGADPKIADRVEALSRSLDGLSQHRAVYGRIMGTDLRERLGATAFDHLLHRAGLVHQGIYFSPGTPPYDIMRRAVEIKLGSKAVEGQTFDQIEAMFEELVAQAQQGERREAA